MTYVLSTSSVRLGTANSHPACSYKYHALNAFVFALAFASFRLDPCPSPNFSLPEKTPTTNTGTRVCRPDSAMRREMGRGMLSRSHRRVSSWAGDWARYNDDNGGRVRERICALMNALVTLRPFKVSLHGEWGCIQSGHRLLQRGIVRIVVERIIRTVFRIPCR